VRPTSRFYAAAGVGLVLATVGALAKNPQPVYGAAVLGGWLVAAAALTVRTFVTQEAALDLEYVTDTRTVRVDRELSATLTLTRPSPPLPCSVAITLPLPPGMSATTERTLHVEDTATDGEIAVTIQPSVVGSFTLSQPELTLSGPFGLFTQTIHRGPRPEVDVTARTPGPLHVGQGGQSRTSVYGEHSTDRAGQGITPRELRQYQPGESAVRIDWKATARLVDPYIREMDAETDRRTVLVVDHSHQMGQGPPGEAMLAAASEVAFGITQQAATVGDPVGLWTVGNAGITTAIPPDTAPSTLRRVRRRLLDIRPTEAATAREVADITATDQTSVDATSSGHVGSAVRSDGDTATRADPSNSSRATTTRSTGPLSRSPTRARNYAERLADDSTPFGRTLQPYFDAADPYVRLLRADPFVETVRRVRSQVADGGLLVLVTSDADRARLEEAVRIAVDVGATVFVFLTPTALYPDSETSGDGDSSPRSDPDPDVDADRYADYVAFETLRQDLSRHPQVSAFEVAPSTRLDALLAARRSDGDDGLNAPTQAAPDDLTGRDSA
jgi:uncharacterized protein (DUF58 family)